MSVYDTKDRDTSWQKRYKEDRLLDQGREVRRNGFPRHCPFIVFWKRDLFFQGWDEEDTKIKREMEEGKGVYELHSINTRETEK